MRFGRITVEPDRSGGVPCVRGLRIPVATVVGMVAEGMTVAEILTDYPDLEAADIAEALGDTGRLKRASVTSPLPSPVPTRPTGLGSALDELRAEER